MGAKDILSPEGFVRFLWAVMNILPNGLMAAGNKWSTWSIVNRALACLICQWIGQCNLLFQSLNEGFLGIPTKTHHRIRDLDI